jgi:hypothetical protein
VSALAWQNESKKRLPVADTAKEKVRAIVNCTQCESRVVSLKKNVRCRPSSAREFALQAHCIARFRIDIIRSAMFETLWCAVTSVRKNTQLCRFVQIGKKFDDRRRTATSCLLSSIKFRWKTTVSVAWLSEMDGWNATSCVLCHVYRMLFVFWGWISKLHTGGREFAFQKHVVVQSFELLLKCCENLHAHQKLDPAETDFWCTVQ